MKMNSLLDAPCIQALYRASQAGVEVELNVRGICALRPGRARGLGEHPGRLDRRPLPRALAHLLVRARRRDASVYIGSADLMPRNLYNRVELVAPVEDPRLQEPSSLDVLDRAFADNTNAWELGSRRALDAARARTATSPATSSGS